MSTIQGSGDFISTCAGVGGGWRRIVNFNISAGSPVTSSLHVLVWEEDGEELLILTSVQEMIVRDMCLEPFQYRAIVSGGGHTIWC